MNTSWHSYPKVFALGHRAIKELFEDEVVVEEKIDGSQFSFGRFDEELRVRSRGNIMDANAPEKMFAEAVETVKTLDLRNGWTYRAEYLQKPKHNTLKYERVPDKHLILFDINTGEEEYLSYDDKFAEAQRIDLEVVPILGSGRVADPSTLLAFLNHTSILGGEKVEGVVVKNYHRFGPDKKVLMGKYVSEAFKEIHKKEWKNGNPTTGDIIQRLIISYRTSARWQKAVQHLKESERYTQSPRDIGELIKEVHKDIEQELEDEIKEALYRHALNHIKRGVAAGIAEWYKKELLNEQFEGG